jgi:predicted PurR-regulated permease PerM
MDTSTNKRTEYSFPQRVWITGGIIALIALIILFLGATFSVLLLLLAGVLIATFFRGLAGLIQRKTKWKEGVSLAVSIIGSLLLVVLLFWLIGAKVQSQVSELSQTLPKTIENAKSQLSQSQVGKTIVERVSSPSAQKNMQAQAQTFFKSTFGILGDLYVILFIGIFFTVAPQDYKKGLVKLVPVKGRDKADDVMDKVGSSLKKWLKGQLFAMLVVFILTAIGLAIIGVPMWLVLALIAGILNFIPNFGPLIAMVPAVLVGLMAGPSTALWVAILYVLVQVAESNFITPMVQHKMIDIPPALVIIAQLFIAPLTGGWGLVLATPLMVIILVLVQELWVKRQERVGIKSKDVAT